MLDHIARKVIDHPLNWAGRKLASWGVVANIVTFLGMVSGLFAAFLIAMGHPLFGLLVLIISRILDGLDGAVARTAGGTDFGGYFDIIADFTVYGAIPFAFIVLDPEANAVAGGLLLLSFYVNGASFLGFALFAERHKIGEKAFGNKAFYYAKGLLEGTETLIFLFLICLLPGLFSQLSYLFALLCFSTTFLRLIVARKAFAKEIS